MLNDIKLDTMSNFNQYTMNVDMFSMVPWNEVSDKDQKIFNMIYESAEKSDHQLHRLGACICFQGEDLLWLQPE